MSDEQHSPLYAAAARLEEQRKAKEAHRPTPMPRLTAEQREENLRKSREHNLLDQGLQRLREGTPCTPTQAPFVGTYISDYEEKIKEARRQAERALADAEYERESYKRIAAEWNEIWATLKDLGLVLYQNHTGHGWRGIDHEGKEVISEGHATLGEALRTALVWWRAQR